MLRSRTQGTKKQKYTFTWEWSFGFHKLMGLIKYPEEVEYNKIYGFMKVLLNSWLMKLYQMVKRTLRSFKKYIHNILG